jgi:hypothetical protein
MSSTPLYSLKSAAPSKIDCLKATFVELFLIRWLLTNKRPRCSPIDLLEIMAKMRLIPKMQFQYNGFIGETAHDQIDDATTPEIPNPLRRCLLELPFK